MKRFGKYRRKSSLIVKRYVNAEVTRLNCEMIWKIWKKIKLKCEMKWKTWQNGKSNSDKI
jgi:hypothetical protein